MVNLEDLKISTVCFQRFNNFNIIFNNHKNRYKPVCIVFTGLFTKTSNT